MRPISNKLIPKQHKKDKLNISETDIISKRIYYFIF